MPSYAAIDQQNNNAIFDTKSVGVVCTGNGEVAVLVSAFNGGKMMQSPKALFVCDDAVKALQCIVDFYERAKIPGFNPSKVQWTNGKWVGGAVVDTGAPVKPSIITPGG